MPDPRPTGPFDYRLFGLAVRSDLELPELRPAGAGDPDVCIKLATIGEGEESLSIEGIARFLVDGGREIRVQPEPNAAPRNVRLYLLGSGIGLLLHQRGLLPLHASAIDLGGKAVAFLGASGSGKSTLAAWFHDHGHAVLTDDVCVIRFDGDGSPVVVPGMPRMRLWKDALQARGREPTAFERSYAGDDDWEKYDVPLDGHEDRARPLAAIYLLGRGDEWGISPLEGLAKADALFANTYRGAVVEAQGDAVGHWQACVALAARIPMFKLERTWELAEVEDHARATLAHAAKL